MLLLVPYGRSAAISIFRFKGKNLVEFGFCQKIQQYDLKITFNYVTVSIIGNDEYIILC